jgi:hypothetical protein
MTRRLTAVLLALFMVFAAVPAFARNGEDEKQQGNGGLVLDTDPAGGYEGDYVVIYNPATNYYTSYNTGNMTGLIETAADPYAKSVSRPSDEPVKIDVDGMIAELDAKADKPEETIAERTSYNVGDTRNFTISYYSPGSSSLSFKCLAKGDHCYVWTPAQNNSNFYPLDVINPDFAQMVADEFDAKYPLMNSSFGDHSNGSQGDGRIHLMYYNIDDGWNINVTTGYVAGYFSSGDFSANSLPMIHIDTYPGVYYVNAQGEERIRITNTYSVFCHEYQHLINYSQTGGMDTWLNECMSAAAEEICYPGSSVVSRIQSWENYYFSDNGDWLSPPTEFAYTPEYELHNGFSMYEWDNYLEYILPLYSQVSLFAQYLFTHYGNPIFRDITQRYANGSSDVSAIAGATGMNTSELVKNFRIALTANDPDSFGGLYGFVPQEGYDPENYNGVRNPYDLLSPVIFTGASCSIVGGGAIVVKPIGGVYNPPSGANSSLVYIGVTRNISTEPVGLNGMTLSPDELTIYVGMSSTVMVVRNPVNANDYDVEWSVADPSLVNVSGSPRSAYITGVAEGRTLLTCTATDRATGRTFTANTIITVEPYPTLDEALNVTGGTLTFTSNTTYPWVIDMNQPGRLCAHSTNQAVASSASTVQTVITMQAGETLTFDWSVSSETNYDKLKFFVNGSLVTDINGSVAFTSYTYTAASSGTYTFKWSYEKDSSVNSGSDTAWLDNVAYSGDPGEDFLLGDADMNGAVESADALLVLRYLNNAAYLNSAQRLRADMNQDGVIGTEDALLILRRTMGLY